MTILKELPTSADEYFDFYHRRSREELVKPGDLDLVLEELRRAYKQYPDRQKRIASMAKIVTMGKNAKPTQEKETAKLVADITQSLMQPQRPTVVDLQKKYGR